eukprot:CAMPEP_0203751262 /NCGR_PEP_ID=MMETSP0098-20131031/5361_1 /ASSEMBLY_ACC=CAM_ASM_000208 /TAXON_ID=96639 /ORGANISM=" , Strain NY0313808BC1" /LENGTH=503 /DNA_ID=CAMNT_0050640895 /DNA_START=24 /DNA_END=1532 /DNA_ORIENTATION=-
MNWGLFILVIATLGIDVYGSRNQDDSARSLRRRGKIKYRYTKSIVFNRKAKTRDKQPTFDEDLKLLKMPATKCSKRRGRFIKRVVLVNEETTTFVRQCQAVCAGNWDCKVFSLFGRLCETFRTCKVQQGSRIRTTVYRKWIPPKMGYSTWNAFYKSANEALLRTQVGEMQSNGLIAAGYKVIHMDGYCTFKNLVTIDGKEYVERSLNAQGRVDATSKLEEPNTCITSGMKGYVKWLKDLNLTVSWYTPGGSRSCNGKEYRTEAHYEQLVENDINTYREWGIDVLKIDQCNGFSGVPRKFRGYTKMIKLWKLKITKLYPTLEIENCKYGCHSISQYPNRKHPNGIVNRKPKINTECKYYSSLFRTYSDIRPWAATIFRTAESFAPWLKLSSPENGWAYGDAMTVCNYNYSTSPYRPADDQPEEHGELTPALEKAHYGMWVIASQPLFISAPVEDCRKDILALLKNPDIIKINQHYSGDAGSVVRLTGNNLLQTGSTAGRIVKRW